MQAALPYLFTLSLCAIPFVYSTALLDPEQSIRFVYLLLVGSIALAASWITNEKKLLSAFREATRISNPFFVALCILLLCALLSVSTAAQKSDAWTEAARVASFLFFYLFIFTILKAHPGSIVRLATCFCVCAFLFCYFAISDFQQLSEQLHDSKALYGMTGRMGHRNLLAIFLALCLPFHALALQRYRSVSALIFFVVNILLSAAVIALTTSRVGWTGLAAILFLAMVFIFWGDKKGLLTQSLFRKSMLLFVACVFAFVAMLAVYFFMNRETSKNITQRLTSVFNYKEQKNEHTETIRERLRLWHNTVEIIKEHPLTGVGAGNWKFHFPAKGMGGIRSENGLIHFQQPHNDFLWVWAETGVAGWLAFVGLFVAALVVALKKMRRDTTLHQFTVLAVALCGTGAYFFASLFDFPKERPLHLFAFACFLAIISAADSGSDDANAVSETVSFSKKKWRALLLLLLLLQAGVMSFWVMRTHAETHLKRALLARKQANYKEVFRELDFIYQPLFEVDLTGTPLNWYKGEAAFFSGNTDASKQFFESSLKANPCHLYTLSNLGSLYYIESDTAKAIAQWDKALAIAPGFAEANLNRAIAHYDKGEIGKAVEPLSRFTLEKLEEKHRVIITTILREYILSIKKDAASPELAEVLQRIAQTDEWLLTLQVKMVSARQTDAAVWKEAIYTAAVLDKSITPQTADSLRKFYNLSLDK